jgi:hypothetical protein
MARSIWLLGALLAALALAVLANRAPPPRPADAAATLFSADRAMVDVRSIARAPHPVGSAEHTAVRLRLLDRMGQLGLSPTLQSGPLSPAALRRLERWDIPSDGLQAVNLIGILPGTRPDLPAVLLMAHYDSVAGSPGAADDASGVAAILETVRALQARGPRPRDVVVLITDAEELGLDGARAFFGGHPLRDRIGAVINLEARGGGGRAMMFETGKGNAETVALFARAGARADGGVTSSALAVFVYELMPNGSDFTVPRDRGVQGINLAFIGRPEQYHTPLSTPGALDRGSLQHIGSQALETADALARAEILPAATTDAVYADVFGRWVIAYPPVIGWAIVLLSGLLTGFAILTVQRRGVSGRQMLWGAVEGLWVLSAGVVAAHAVRSLGGPTAGRADSAEAYYALLARLPWLEAGAALAVLAVALLALAGRGRLDRRWVAGSVAALAALALILGGPNPVVIGAAVIALGLSFAPGPEASTPWPAWLGLLGLVWTLALIAQALAPATAFLFAWPALIVGLAAAVTARVDPQLRRPAALGLIGVLGAGTAGWALALAHPVFLGIGMDLPGVLALLGLLALMAVRPLGGPSRGLAVAAALALLAGAGFSAAAPFMEPVAPAADRVG